MPHRLRGFDDDDNNARLGGASHTQNANRASDPALDDDLASNFSFMAWSPQLPNQNVPRRFVVRGASVAVCALLTFFTTMASLNTNVLTFDGIVDNLRVDGRLDFQNTCTRIREEGIRCEDDEACREYTLCATRSNIRCGFIRDLVNAGFLVGAFSGLSAVPCAVFGVLDAMGKLPFAVPRSNSRLLLLVVLVSSVLTVAWVSLVCTLLFSPNCNSGVALNQGVYGIATTLGAAVYFAVAALAASFVSSIVVVAATCCCARAPERSDASSEATASVAAGNDFNAGLE